MKRILFVADISNLYYTTSKKLGGKINYTELLKFIEEKFKGKIHRAVAYGSDMDGEADPFKNFLKSIGFEIKYKTPKIYYNKMPDGTVKENRKANWDTGIVIDVVRILDAVDIVVFGTADGDFEPCVQYVQERGREAYVIGSQISDSLKATANDCFEINDSLLERRST